MILSSTAIVFGLAGATSTAAPLEAKPPPKKHQKLKVEKSCKAAKKAIIYYRSLVWDMQDGLGVDHSTTRHPERWVKSCNYLNWIASWWHQTAHKLKVNTAALSEPSKAICFVFGRYCSQALAVSWCESKLHTTAQNGQYLGMFQMGSSERRLYGHGTTPLEQARAAFAYFVASGRDWSPWSCKPW